MGILSKASIWINGCNDLMNFNILLDIKAQKLLIMRYK